MAQKCKIDKEGFCTQHGWDCGDFQLYQNDQATLNAATPIVLVPILYRDANNYKEISELAFVGTATEALVERLAATLHEGDKYLPTQIGHDHLGTRLDTWYDPDSDHVWQEIDIDSIEQINDDPDEHAVQPMNFEDFVALMEKQNDKDWDVIEACRELGVID